MTDRNVVIPPFVTAGAIFTRLIFARSNRVPIRYNSNDIIINNVDP